MSGEDRGCCRHCIDGCKGVSGVWAHTAQDQPRDRDWPSKLTAYVVWQDGCCPMCAEAARIAAWLRHRPGIEVYLDTDGQQSMRVHHPATFADAIDRGDM